MLAPAVLAPEAPLEAAQFMLNTAFIHLEAPLVGGLSNLISDPVFSEGDIGHTGVEFGAHTGGR